MVKYGKCNFDQGKTFRIVYLNDGRQIGEGEGNVGQFYDDRLAFVSEDSKALATLSLSDGGIHEVGPSGTAAYVEAPGYHVLTNPASSAGATLSVWTPALGIREIPDSQYAISVTARQDWLIWIDAPPDRASCELRALPVAPLVAP